MIQYLLGNPSDTFRCTIQTQRVDGESILRTDLAAQSHFLV